MKFDIQNGIVTKVFLEKDDVKDDILELRLPESTTVIGQEAFNRIELPPILWIKEGATEIASSAFEGHKELRSVSFPSTMRKIGSRAFAGCEGLSNIDFCHTNLFALDCFEDDYFIRWLRKDGDIARALYFPREKIYAIMIKNPQLSSSSYTIYEGRFCTNPGFPNCEVDTNHPLLYFCSYIKDGKESIWYDTLLDWAIQGAKYQAFNMTPREFLGREIKFDGSSSMTINEFGVIMGICFSGLKYMAIWLKKKRHEYFKIDSELLAAAENFAPLVLKKFKEILEHQTEVWPVDRNYFRYGIRWSDHWSSTGKTPEQGNQEVFQLLEERGALYDYNKWAY